MDGLGASLMPAASPRDVGHLVQIVAAEGTQALANADEAGVVEISATALGNRESLVGAIAAKSPQKTAGA